MGADPAAISSLGTARPLSRPGRRGPQPRMIGRGKKATRRSSRAWTRAWPRSREPRRHDAWRTFSKPGDVVGIKVVPNGQPYAHSSFELVLETIEGFKSAGVKTRDMFVFDRYRAEFLGRVIRRSSRRRSGGGAHEEGANSSTRFPDSMGDPIVGLGSGCLRLDDLVPYGDDPKDDR